MCGSAVHALDYSPTAKLLVSGHSDHFASVWDPRMDAATLQPTKLRHEGWVSAVEWAPESTVLLSTTSYDGKLRVWDLRSPRLPLHSVSDVHEQKKVLALDFSRGHSAITGGADAKVRVTKLR